MRTFRAGVLLLAAGLLAGCYDDPVQQRLELRFRPDGAVEVEAVVRIRHPDALTDDQVVRARAERLRAALALDGLGWPRRLEQLAPERRRYVEDLEGDELRQRRFSTLVADPARLEKALSEGLVRLLFQRSEEGVNELVLLIEPGSRANRRQRDLVDAREERIAATYLDYLEAAEELSVFLEERPERAADVLWHVLDGGDASLNSQTEVEEPELLDEEGPVVERMSVTMEAVLDAFNEIPEGEQHTINELSRLVHDPFDHDVVVRLPRPPLEVEGFLRDEGTLTFRAPRRSITEAIEELSARWLEPDWLLLLWEGPWQHDEMKFDYAELAERPRRAEPPASTAELRAALDQALRPPDLLRLRWESLPPPDPGVVDWEAEAQR